MLVLACPVLVMPGVESASLHAQSSVTRSPVPGAHPGIIALVDVNVIPMDTERVLKGQTVLVEGGRITALGSVSQVKVPASATRIDSRDKYLLPGLGDCHTHLGFGNADRQGIPDAERQLFRWFANGVTTIRNMDFWDKDDALALKRNVWYLNGKDVLQLRARAAAGALWSPRIYTAGQWAPLRYTSEYALDAKQKGEPVPPLPPLDSVVAYVAAFKAAGYDFIKVHSESDAMLDLVLAVSRQIGIPVGGHIGGHRRQRTSALLEKALAGGMRSIEHLAGYPSVQDMSPAAVQALVAATVRAGTWNCVTIGVTKGYRREYLRPLQDAGAGLLLGTDTPLFGSIHDELELLVEQGGLTPYEALATGTKNMAVFFQTLNDEGTIAVGKRADLVLLAGNPLDNIRHTRQPAVVMVGGRWLVRDELDRRLAANTAAAEIKPN